MYQPRFKQAAVSPAGLIEAQIITGLAHCKPIAEIAAEIAAQLQAVPDRQ